MDLKQEIQKNTLKTRAKYELNRDNCTNYADFLQIYNLVYEEIKEAGAAVCIETPEW